jgi:hypothetical protein
MGSTSVAPTPPRPSRQQKQFRQVCLVVSTVLTVLTAVPAMAMARAGAAAASVELSLVASSSTTVGLQVYAVVDIWGGTNPTGTVTFELFGPSDPTCAAAPLFISTVSLATEEDSAVASARYTTSAVGTYRWEVGYSGDANNAAVAPTSCSASSAAVVVSPYSAAASVTGVTSSGGTTQASANLYGLAPTGTLTFYLSPPGDSFCSSTVFTSTVPVHGSGTYQSAPYVYREGGQYSWRVAYSGDADNMASSVSACMAGPNQTTVAAPPATGLLYPQDGQSQVSASVPFTWQAAPGAQGYFLEVGTTRDGWDLAWSGTLPASQTSYSIAALPAGTLWALLYTEVGGAWSSQTVSFTAIPTEAELLSPTSGATGVNPAGTVRWSTVPGAQSYMLWVSTVYGGANLVNTSYLPPSVSSYTPSPPLPAGNTLYLVLFTERGGVLTGQCITITTAGG